MRWSSYFFQAREQEYGLDPGTGCFSFFFSWRNQAFWWVSIGLYMCLSSIDGMQESGRLGRLLNHNPNEPNLRPKVFGVICPH